MWIKSLDTDVWVNINHITHFSIYKSSNEVHSVRMYLDATGMEVSGSVRTGRPDQTFVRGCEGALGKCRRFIWRKQFTAWLSKWLGYLVAGDVGAVLTYLFTKYGLPLP